ncbi:MAG: Na+/H+ antiporter [Candidatus Melainabacteria bacterium]|nr:Na+/H+ antiporter [Candidatus Melainabacteria bacterium]
MSHDVHILLILILVATSVAIAVKWIKLPYSIALVLVGLGIGQFNLLPSVHMTPELILLVFLPSLLFEASWNLNLHMLKRCWKPVVLFATLGVFLSTIIVGYVIHLLAGVDLAIAMVLGAMISATDPISVLALFKKMGIEKRLVTILEGESLLNDGTAVALFRILMAAAISGGALSGQVIVSQFLIVVLGGIVSGLLVGFLTSFLTRFFDDHLLEITLTIIAAYGSYIIAEEIHVSSVMSVLVAGVVLGNYGSRSSMSPTTRLAVGSFWEFAAFMAESMVFLLIGLQIKFELLMKYSTEIGIAILAILIGRIVVIYGLAPLVSTRINPIPSSWRHLLFWGGLRGSLCMAMALSLPLDFPLRENLMVTTFGVALFTILIQGLSFEPIVHFLKVKQSNPTERKGEALREELNELENEVRKLISSGLSANAINKEKKQLKSKIDQTEKLILKLEEDDTSIADIERIQIEKLLAHAQQDCLNTLARQNKVSKSIIKEFRVRVNQELESLQIETPPVQEQAPIAELTESGKADSAAPTDKS